MTDTEPPGGLAMVDTNVLVYIITPDDPRQPVAAALVDQLAEAGELVTSTQVLQEFFVISTRKIQRPISPSTALAYLDRFSRWPVITHDYAHVREAAELTIKESISLWDALIVLSAAKARARRIYTEDMKHGQVIRGVQIWNPFTHPVRA